ncbi:hypothetical protein ACJX0J_008755, partial [Zea mays]
MYNFFTGLRILRKAILESGLLTATVLFSPTNALPTIYTNFYDSATVIWSNILQDIFTCAHHLIMFLIAATFRYLLLP